MSILRGHRRTSGAKFTSLGALALAICVSPNTWAQSAPAAPAPTAPAPAPPVAPAPGANAGQAPAATTAPAPAPPTSDGTAPTETAPTAAPVGSDELSGSASTTDASVSTAPVTLDTASRAAPGDSDKNDSGKEEDEQGSAADGPSGVKPPALEISAGELKLALGLRAIGGWEYEHTELTAAQEQQGTRATDFEFFLSQARFTVDGDWGKEVSMQLDLDFSSSDPIRDAWLNYRVMRPLQFRVGQFKRPFSRLELMGAGKLPMRRRGLANDHIVNDLGYGERSVGAQAWGRFKKQGLEWAVSASNPPPGISGVDLHARLAYEPTPWLEVGAGVAHKITEDRRTIREDFIGGSGFGIDVDIHTGGTHILIDALMGENLGLAIDQPDPLAIREDSGSLGALVTHDLDLNKRWTLQPVLFGEWVDSNLEYTGSEVVRAVVGLNALWNRYALRVMPQVELIRPLETGPVWTENTAFYIMVSSEL